MLRDVVVLVRPAVSFASGDELHAHVQSKRTNQMLLVSLEEWNFVDVPFPVVLKTVHASERFSTPHVGVSRYEHLETCNMCPSDWTKQCVDSPASGDIVVTSGMPGKIDAIPTLRSGKKLHR